MASLKEATSIKHKQAERMPFNSRMAKGLLTKNEYLLHLWQQLQIFRVIESKGLPNASMKRSEKINMDIEELKAQGFAVGPFLKSTKEYYDYLDSKTAEELLPHVYLNYLGLLFGGQIIKKGVPSTGHMYDFDNKAEIIYSIRNIQRDDWADEVNKGFDYIIQIFEELETCCNAEFVK
jgi:heme oxygenase